VTLTLRVPWPEPALFEARDGRPLRLLAISDEREPALESEETRRGLGFLDMIVGCGDLQPEYLAFVADAFGGVPLVYVRGNHDVGAAWRHAEGKLLPEPLKDGEVHREAGLSLVGFGGSPRYSDRGHEVSALEMWMRVIPAWTRLRGRGPVVVVTHAAPRGLNDAADPAHRGFEAFRWLAHRLAPPLWLHGHTALVRRGLDERVLRSNGTLLYNCTGATLIELNPPGDADPSQAELIG
jgi:Icc-related predicted phosphoesterase